MQRGPAALAFALVAVVLATVGCGPGSAAAPDDAVSPAADAASGDAGSFATDAATEAGGPRDGEAPLDSGTSLDAGSPLDGSFTSPWAAPTNLVATTGLADRVTLTWSPPPDIRLLTGYRITADSAELVRIGASTTYDDTSAPPAASLGVPTNLSATNGTRPTGVVVEWDPPPTAGPGVTYQVEALYGVEMSDPSNAAVGSRGVAITDYELSRDDGASWQSVGLVTQTEDTSAPKVPLTFPTPTARVDVRTIVVVAISSWPTVGQAPAVTYRVRAVAGATKGPASASVQGARGAGSLTDADLQWQRSTEERDASYRDLTNVTGAAWYDAISTMGELGYYRVRATATWTEDSGSASAAATRVGYKSVVRGGTQTCAIRSDDKVVCWGSNAGGVGPPGPSADSFKSISAGGYVTCGVRSDDKVVCWGDSPLANAPSDSFKSVSVAPENFVCGVRSDDKVLCWGNNDYGQAPPTATTDSFKSVSAGDRSACGVRSDDKVVCWGSNNSGVAPTTPSTDSFKSVSVGYEHACGVRTDDKVVCWGTNSNGEAPPGPSIDSFQSVSAAYQSTCGIRADGKPVCWGLVTPVPSTGADIFTSISLAQSACALRTDGSMLCWGENSSGEAPPIPNGDPFVSVAAGSQHTCGLRPDGKIVCWGAAGWTPPTPTVETFTNVVAGFYHTCAVRSDGKVLCWGNNDVGQAPPGPTTDFFKSVSAGALHSCGVRSDDKVVCWGYDSRGQAPAGPSADSFKSVSAGADFTCGVRSDDKVVCWGDNDQGQAPSTPSTDSFKSVAAGSFDACGIRSDDTVACWGYSLGSPSATTDGFLAVAVGGGRYGIDLQGHLVAGGSPLGGAQSLALSMSFFTNLSASREGLCAVRADKKVICFGTNDYGQGPTL